MSIHEHQHLDIQLPPEWGSLPDRRLVFAQHLEAHGVPPWKPEDDRERQLCIDFLRSQNPGRIPHHEPNAIIPDHSQPPAAAKMPEQQKGIQSTSLVINELERTGALNGVSLEELEERMRPKGWSEDGFLGPNEKLLDVLKADQQTVDALGLTHVQIADILKKFMPVYPGGYGDFTVAFNGRDYKVRAEAFFGDQESPFRKDKNEPENEDDSTNNDFIVTDVQTGESISFSGLLGHLVREYGFYEGKQTPYRLSPEKIVEFLGVLS